MYHDFVIQLKNGALARKKEITTQYANLNKAIAQVLVKEGFLDSVKEEKVDEKRMLKVVLRYQRRKPAITDLLIISKPSLRTYIAADKVRANQSRSVTAVLSTSAGVMTGKEAIKKGVGGELLFKIW